MSSIYITEPPTKGKVVNPAAAVLVTTGPSPQVLLKTTLGDIDIELWSKEAPLACRNFIQLCLEDYYNDTIFHRVVFEFVAQGGDPTGTGEGGESIYGSPFKDEFHQRLKFNRRGLVGMANGGKNDNTSQFFITLGRTDELNNKNTLFGKVRGVANND
ncbi:PREDICTED: peptidyl-prolyl cis-trans isomerase CWC27 homolog isoform X1 [Amphimedon queenslandica]|uniref:Peptidyl-prolyl cis-trans isomerase n=1 Tax=Amphimedon queenslandica TaxID=400682 RepID=A0AAN0K2K6_AMPQE|nr:PREDICTED: peptidyl-prolyl cis-trans isomerase CWC27 homolog isoform X1 [Amphimedon queenslandica]|eukprot:XP_019863502.1 PREDICTED: peptidyl-prolyl cis-trans isomerase CWC27 homolog isoform X1 [Amphimedon queenslandica]